MRFRGEWIADERGSVRPLIDLRVPRHDGKLERDWFLIDTGADRTVFSAFLRDRLGMQGESTPAAFGLSGIGGGAASVVVSATLVFRSVAGNPASIEGTFTAFVDEAAMDVSILGRDVLDNFDLIVSRRRNEVLLLAPKHRYEVMQG